MHVWHVKRGRAASCEFAQRGTSVPQLYALIQYLGLLVRLSRLWNCRVYISWYLGIIEAKLSIDPCCRPCVDIASHCWDPGQGPCRCQQSKLHMAR